MGKAVSQMSVASQARRCWTGGKGGRWDARDGNDVHFGVDRSSFLLSIDIKYLRVQLTLSEFDHKLIEA